MALKLTCFCRLKFEMAQLDGTRERLQRLRATVERERHNLEDKLESDLAALQAEIREAEAQVEELRTDLEHLEKEVEEKSTAVSTVRKDYNKASRALDEVSKDISGWVSSSRGEDGSRLNLVLQRDEMESAASERYSIYRKCRLEDIQIPLLDGDLAAVPITEVSRAFYLTYRG